MMPLRGLAEPGNGRGTFCRPRALMRRHPCCVPMRWVRGPGPQNRQPRPQGDLLNPVPWPHPPSSEAPCRGAMPLTCRFGLRTPDLMEVRWQRRARSQDEGQRESSACPVGWNRTGNALLGTWVLPPPDMGLSPWGTEFPDAGQGFPSPLHGPGPVPLHFTIPFPSRIGARNPIPTPVGVA